MNSRNGWNSLPQGSSEIQNNENYRINQSIDYKMAEGDVLFNASEPKTFSKTKQETGDLTRGITSLTQSASICILLIVTVMADTQLNLPSTPLVFSLLCLRTVL